MNDKLFKDLRLVDLQHVVDTCGKNYPTLQKLKVLFNQLYDYAIKNDICNKIYSEFVDIVRYKERNPNKYDRKKFSKDEIKRLWELRDDKYYQIVLMLIYNGLRISEFLDLKKVDVHLDEQYFDVVDSKHFLYRNYYDSYFTPLMQNLNIEKTPHCCRHTCISLLAEAGVDQTIIKKIAGHSGFMSLTEKVYTHFDVQELVKAINQI